MSRNLPSPVPQGWEKLPEGRMRASPGEFAPQPRPCPHPKNTAFCGNNQITLKHGPNSLARLLKWKMMTALLRTALTGLLLCSVPATAALAYDSEVWSSGSYLAGRSAAKLRDNGHASDYLSSALKADAGGTTGQLRQIGEPEHPEAEGQGMGQRHAGCDANQRGPAPGENARHPGCRDERQQEAASGAEEVGWASGAGHGEDRKAGKALAKI